MRDKIMWALIVAVGIAVVLVQGQSTPRTDSQIGRYQIVAVPGNANENAQVFKIDTATGTTWIKAIGADDTIAWSDLKNVKIAR